MTTNSPDLRTKLGKVRKLGSARRGVGHWWLQRITALALIPLSLWFVNSLLSTMLSPDPRQTADYLSSSVNAVLMVLLLVTAFVHAKLGVQVIIEDYIHSPVPKYGLLLANVFLCFSLCAISILAVLKMHFLDMASGAV